MVYLAVDVGASSGKLVKAHLCQNGKVETEVVHKFKNTLTEKNGSLVWDVEMIFQEIVAGLRKAGKIDCIAIDTWGVDFVLLDESGNVIGDAVSYRDKRTERLQSMPDQKKLYKRTGIQMQRFNTIYQLMALKEEKPEELEKAAYLLFIPDYLSYRLTGVIKHEYTFATTTNLVNPETRGWDYDLIKDLALPVHLFTELSDPGTEVGPIKPEIAEKIGCSPLVILAPSHDSASAAFGAPIEDDGLFISSGTWSIIGCLEDKPHLEDAAAEANLSNEGGMHHMIRLIKNIMGTWMLQRIAAETDASVQDLEDEARVSKPLGKIDATDPRFLAPESMSKEIEAVAGKRAESRGELAATVYYALAEAYKAAVDELEAITGRSFGHIAIVGGGSKDGFLNDLTAMYTHRIVTAGPDEGTALGNILAQMVAKGELLSSNKNDAIKKSVPITQYRRI